MNGFPVSLLLGLETQSEHKNGLRPIHLSAERQSYSALHKPSSLSPEKAMQSVPMHCERQIYLATLEKEELLAMGSMFCHIKSNFLLKTAEWCPQNYDIYSHSKSQSEKKTKTNKQTILCLCSSHEELLFSLLV